MPRSCKCILDRAVFKGAMSEEDRDKIMRNLKGIEWHPYPKEKPTEDAKYVLVTIYEGEKRVRTTWWIDDAIRFGVEDEVITAWAELPKPYEEGADE